MTETISDEKIVISAESTPLRERIKSRKTIVYETLVDPTVIKVASEKLKQELFTKYWFFKPKAEEIQFVSIDKYYEPYIVISGRYLIDYYRRCLYTVNVEDGVLEVILFNNKFVPKRPENSMKDSGVIRLEGEERLTKEAKASFIFDRCGRDATLERLPSAPSEKNPKKIIAKFRIEEIPKNVEVNFVRDRLVKRPQNIKRVVDEVFEVAERVVIYTPEFKIIYKNVKTGEEKALVFDGVTSERIRHGKSTISQGMRTIKSHIK